jgi:pimeloyl-ACP methyl ester carboxylesterase
VPRTSLHLPALALVIGAAVAVALSSARDLRPPEPSAHYAFGNGSTIVLVHGLGSRNQHWFATARLLARHHRVVFADLPGHGDTGMPDPFSLERAEEALDHAIAEASNEPVILVGHSLGGLVAAAEALDHPSRVRGLVLVESALRPQVEAANRGALLAALDGDYAAVLRAAYESFGRDSAQGAALYAEVSQLDPTHIKPWIRLALTADLSRRAAEFNMPVLAVLAERSWGMSEAWPDVARTLGYEHIVHMQRLRIAGTGHFIMLDQPDELAGAIERFADQAEGVPLALR